MTHQIFSKPGFFSEQTDDQPDNAPPTIGGGTLIETSEGAVPVDWLVAGDKVLTRDHGFQPLLWIGRAVAPMARNVPMTIEAHSLGHGCPDRTMSISANSQIMLNGPEIELYFAQYEVFVAAGQIWHWRGIAADHPQGDVPHYCLLFGMHELVSANNIWVGTMQNANVAAQGLTQRSNETLSDIRPEIDDERIAARMCLLDHEALVLQPPEQMRVRRAA